MLQTIHYPFLVLSLLIALSISAFASENKESKEKLPSQKIINVCLGCHGVNGNSTDSTFPKIAGLSKSYIKKQLIDFREGRRENNEMFEVMKIVSSESILDEVAHYFSLQKRTSNSSCSKQADANAIKIKLGEAIHTGKRIDYGIPACLHCHGKEAKDNKKYPRLLGQHKQYLIKQMQLFRAKERTNDVPAMMQNIMIMMDDEDIESVATYISSLECSSDKQKK